MTAAPPARKYVLVKYYADWCSPCAAMAKAKTLEKLAEEFNLDLVKVDVEDPTTQWKKAAGGVQAVPTIHLFEYAKLNYGKPIPLATFEGASDLKTLRKWVKDAITVE